MGKYTHLLKKWTLFSEGGKIFKEIQFGGWNFRRRNPMIKERETPARRITKNWPTKDRSLII
jgi:hypothetical protein